MTGLKTLCFSLCIICIGSDLATSQNIPKDTGVKANYVNVKFNDGIVRGREITSNGLNSFKYYSFLGIPYAKPPVEELRFEEPVPVEPWIGVRDTLQEGPNPPQIHTFFYDEVGEEDCLYLNVFSKKLSNKTEDLKPVMVYIFAGGFTSGSGDKEVYGPDFLLEEDIVLVTFNYRVGALGFLSLEDNRLPGNAGLKDQVLALEWVKKNIRQFGGDPGCVTIFGISAGGASVQYHLLSPLSKGLFHRAIIQSGSALNPWAYENNPLNMAVRLAKKLGYNDDFEDIDKLIHFFKKVPAKSLVKAQSEVLTIKEKYHTLMLPIRPTVEKEGPGKQFITQTPREILENGNFTRVPLIIGCTGNEGNLQLEAVPLNESVFEEFNNDTNLLIPLDMLVRPDERNHVQETIHTFYFNDKTFSWETINNYIELFGDLTFYQGLDDTLRLMLKNSTSPVYNYLLTYENSRSFLRSMARTRYPHLEIQGTPHGDDIPLLFKQGHRFLQAPQIPEKDKDVIRKMVKLWTTFAATGNPNFDGLDSVWEATHPDDLRYYDIGNEFKMVSGKVHEKRMKFWENLYSKTGSGHVY